VAVLQAVVKLKGLKKFRRNLMKAGTKALSVARSELQRQTVLTLALAQSNAPLLFGLLRKNVRVQAARVIRRKAVIGGRTLPVFLRSSFTFNQRYAEIQHENLSFRHREGESKFAEKAIKARIRIIIATVAFRLRQAL
jgi:hypothetical protein